MTRDDADPVGDTTAAGRLATEIRRLRKAADLSQPKLAAMIGYSPQYVSLVERPGKGIPSASLIDRALDAGGVLLDLRGQAEAEQLALRHGATAEHTDSDHRSKGHDTAAVGPSGDDVLRRDFISSSLIAGLRTIVSAPASDRRPDSGLVVRLRQRSARLRRLDDFLGGADTYSLYKAELESTVRLFKDNTHSPATSQELLSVTAEQAQQAGWAAFDAGWNDEALRLYKLALTAAQDGEDPSLEGNSWAYMAYQEVTLGTQVSQRQTILAAWLDRTHPQRCKLSSWRGWHGHTRRSISQETPNAPWFAPPRSSLARAVGNRRIGRRGLTPGKYRS